MRGLCHLGAFLLLGALMQAATLQRLSLEDMAVKSTAIVRARVLDSHSAQRGRSIYTNYRVQVTENWKGTASGTITVSVPGGVMNGLRETVPGAPALTAGSEYVLFLWTGKSGMTQVIGLTQGLFSLSKSATGEATALHTPSGELMLDAATGQAVRDEKVSLGLNELREKVRLILAGGGK